MLVLFPFPNISVFIIPDSLLVTVCVGRYLYSYMRTHVHMYVYAHICIYLNLNRFLHRNTSGFVFFYIHCISTTENDNIRGSTFLQIIFIFFVPFEIIVKCFVVRCA